MNPLRYIPHYTYEDYKLWEGDWELIHGIPYAMSPSPARKHQFLGAQLINGISTALAGKKKDCDECVVYYELDWIISDDTVVRPDIMIVCGIFNTDFLTFPPELIIEILSPGTTIKDRTAKFDIYEQQKVKYYLLADPVLLTLKIFVLAEQGYIETDTKKFNLYKQCELNLDFDSILKSIT